MIPAGKEPETHKESKRGISLFLALSGTLYMGSQDTYYEDEGYPNWQGVDSDHSLVIEFHDPSG